MKYINVKNGPQNISAIILGCMRMPSLDTQKAADMIRTAAEEGINFFDHATCYGKDGEAEKRFGDAFALTGLKREDVYLQSKCGISRDPREFNWTREYIVENAEASLRRLKTDYLDALLCTGRTCCLIWKRWRKPLKSWLKAARYGTSV